MTVKESIVALQDPRVPIYSKVLLRQELERIDDELLKHKQAIFDLEEQKQNIRTRLTRLSR